MSNIGFATLQVIPSLRGLDAALGKGLAPVSGLAAAEGKTAGKVLGGSLVSAAGAQIAPGANSLLRRITAGISSPAGVAGLAAAAFVGLVNVGKQFGSVNRIIRQETGATGSTLKGLGETVKRVFATSPESLKEIATAVDELFKRGVPLGAQLDRLAEQELFLANITGSDLATTVESTTALFAKFNVPLRDQSRELDVLFKAQQQSGKSFEELAGGLQKAGAVLQQFGFNLDESTALIAGLQKAGVNVQPALAGLRLAFGKITQQGGKPKEVLRGIIDELTRGKNPTKAMADAIKLFGNRSGAELAIAIQKGKLSIVDMLKVITDGKGGIIETGRETLTLAQKFSLFKHRALLDLSEFGTKALNVFKTVANQGGPVLGDLIASILHALQELAPALAPIGLLLVGAFKVALPVLSSLAAGIETVASILGHFPTPVLVAAGAVGVLFLAFRALGGVQGLLGAGDAIGAFLSGLNPVIAALVVTAAVVSAVGAVVKIFGGNADAAKKEADELGRALFDASSGAGIFATGISSATQGLERFLASQIKAGKDSTLATTLAHSGTSVADLSKALSRGDKDWKKFTASVVSRSTDVVKANKAIDKSFTGLGSSNLGKNLNEQSIAGSHFIGVSQKVVDSLNKERDAFVLSAQKQFVSVQATGDLSAAQVALIKHQTANRDGSINYAKALDKINVALAEQARKQDAVATHTVETSKTFAQLANAVSTGSISSEAATAALEQLGFSTEGAKTKLKDLTSQVQAFAQAVANALPSVAGEIKTFGQDIASASSAVESDFKTRAGIIQRIADAGGKASKELKDSLTDATKQIVADLHTLAEDQDPAKFTQGLREQAKRAAQFLGNLRVLVKEGFGSLAGILAQQGPEAAGGLAAGLASDESKARVAASAADLLQSTNDSITAFAQGHFAELNGIGEGMARAVVDRFKPDLTPGISKELAAAERALAADSSISQAAGEVGVRAVQQFAGKLTVKDATGLALSAARSVMTNDRSLPDAAGGLSARATARFQPAFGGRVIPAMQAAAVALKGDKTVSQAAGNKALEVVAVYARDLTVDQATALAIRAAHGILANDPTLAVAAGAKGGEATAALGKNFQPGEKAKEKLEGADVTVASAFKLGQQLAAIGHVVGVEFTTGIGQGISDSDASIEGSVLANAVNSLASSVRRRLEKAWGIASPSKVAMRIGRAWIAGVALGLQDTSTLDKAAAKIGASLTKLAPALIKQPKVTFIREPAPFEPLAARSTRVSSTVEESLRNSQPLVLGLTQNFNGPVYGDAHLKRLAKDGAIEALREKTNRDGFVRGARFSG